MEPFIALKSAQAELDHLIASRDFLRCAEVQSKIDLLSQRIGCGSSGNANEEENSRPEDSRLEDLNSSELTRTTTMVMSAKRQVRS